MPNCTKPYKSYQLGGIITPNSPQRKNNSGNTRPVTPTTPPRGMSKEEMQRRARERGRERNREMQGQAVREERSRQMDERMRQGYEKATGTKLK